MENASKALLIAGGILLSILVLSFGLYFLNMYRDHTRNIYKEMIQSQTLELNTKFTKYQGQELTMQDVITIMNLARNNNKKYELTSSTESNYYIEVEGNSIVEPVVPGGNNGNNLISDLKTILEETDDSNYEKRLKDKLWIYNNNNCGEINEQDDIPGVTYKKGKRKMYFECEVQISKETELVKKITITQKNNW